MSTQTKNRPAYGVNSIGLVGGFKHPTTIMMMRVLFKDLEERANNPTEYIGASVKDAIADLARFKAAGFYKPNVKNEGLTAPERKS